MSKRRTQQRTRSRARRRRGSRSVKRRYVLKALAIAAAGLVLYGAFAGWQIAREFENRGWDVPARVYAAPFDLYAGRRLGAGELANALEAVGYRRDASLTAPGTWRSAGAAVELHRRAFDTAEGHRPAEIVRVTFADGRVGTIETQSGERVAALELDPMLIGSIFPAHGEDRIIVAPDAIPEVLARGLIVVEDRRFEHHIGIDPRAIVRAAIVNIRNGEIEQGASTLTQQLVRSYFLSTDRTWWRKIREAFMAIVLEIRYDKETLLDAYINEIYLGQDGARAIHGFGLASRYYFGKPLPELDLHETALLIALVRGPSYYDPRRHPERALERRNLVLEEMLDQKIISHEAYSKASAKPLDIVTDAAHRSAYYPAFLDLVRRQLASDYAPDTLERKGLVIYTTLDPTTQATAESALAVELERLEPGRAPLEGALVVTNPHTGEVRALIGGRTAGYDGFNRALDAHRPIGSLVKPAVYLAALESGRHTLATLVDDTPIDVTLDDGRVWSPQNFDGESHGTVTALRALAESLNMATVRLGMDVGVESVADTLVDLGLQKRPPAYPSLLLGAVELTPLEVTQIYNTLANGGFKMPLRAVRAVVADSGAEVQRYPLAIGEARDPAAVYALDRGLVQVMQHGTGRSAQQRLGSVTSAGKTGTSDGLRDSWFAGFTGDTLAVVWIGNDDNEPIGLTGAGGAERVWARVVADLDPVPYTAPAPASLEDVWIDYDTGLVTQPSCPKAVALAMRQRDLPPTARSCGSTSTRIGSRIRSWLRGAQR